MKNRAGRENQENSNLSLPAFMSFKVNSFNVFMLRPIFVILTIFLLTWCVPVVRAAPITTNTALPVSEGELLLRVQAKYIRSTGDSSSLHRELRVWAAPTVLVYGASEKIALFGIFPWLDKSLDLTTPLGRVNRGDSGMGDFRFLARYTLGQWDKTGETMRLAPFMGLEIPTGKDNTQDSLGFLPSPLQLGSGSWDPMIGTVFTWQKLDWQFDSSLSYKFNTAANGYQFGDEARLDLSFQYRLWPRELGSGVPGFLYGVVESNLIWRDRDQQAAADVFDSGGKVWYLAPGMQYVTERWILEAAVQLPVVQDLNGGALENDYIITAGLRFWF